MPGRIYADEVNFNDDELPFTDFSGTPGFVSISTPRGRFAMAAGGTLGVCAIPNYVPGKSQVFARLVGPPDAGFGRITSVDVFLFPGAVICWGAGPSAGTVVFDFIMID